MHAFVKGETVEGVDETAERIVTTHRVYQYSEEFLYGDDGISMSDRLL